MDQAHNGAGDFDFFAGTWNSVQRKLVKPLADCTEWLETAATTRCWQVFGGTANVDEVHFPDWGYTGLSIRLFNPQTAQWSIYWASSRNGDLGLPPVVGRFADGVGLFYCEESYDGKDITTRYKWSDITATTARWEQAFSLDGRRKWETNWVADFSRTGLSGFAGVSKVSGALCTGTIQQGPLHIWDGGGLVRPAAPSSPVARLTRLRMADHQASHPTRSTGFPVPPASSELPPSGARFRR
jgi:hypothetical protein